MKFPLIVLLFFTFFIVVNLVQYISQRPDRLRRVVDFFSSLFGNSNNFKIGGDMRTGLLMFLAFVGIVVFGVVSFGNLKKEFFLRFFNYLNNYRTFLSF